MRGLGSSASSISSAFAAMFAASALSVVSSSGGRATGEDISVAYSAAAKAASVSLFKADRVSKPKTTDRCAPFPEWVCFRFLAHFLISRTAIRYHGVI